MDTNSSPSELDPVEQLAREYQSRRRRGEHPTPAEYAARYPELAEQILSAETLTSGAPAARNDFQALLEDLAFPADPFAHPK